MFNIMNMANLVWTPDCVLLTNNYCFQKLQYNNMAIIRICFLSDTSGVSGEINIDRVCKLFSRSVTRA